MSTPQWIETCRVCTRDVRNDEVDENGICDECIVVLPDEIRRLRAENERLKEDVELRRQQVVNALSVVRADLVVFRTDSALQIVKRILSELSD